MISWGIHDPPHWIPMVAFGYQHNSSTDSELHSSFPWWRVPCHKCPESILAPTSIAHWRCPNTRATNTYVHKVLLFLREKKEEVVWRKLVWFPHAFPSMLSFCGWLCRIGFSHGIVWLSGDIKVRLSTFSVIIKWKAGSICFFNIVSVIEFGSFVCIIVK